MIQHPCACASGSLSFHLVHWERGSKLLPWSRGQWGVDVGVAAMPAQDSRGHRTQGMSNSEVRKGLCLGSASQRPGPGQSGWFSLPCPGNRISIFQLCLATATRSW